MVKISDAEMEVMKVIWRKKEVTSYEIINELHGHKWNDNTIRTLINRLISKKAVGISKKEGKTYTYVPLVNEEDYKVKKMKNVIKQLYDGSFNEMLLNFIDNNEVSKAELKDLVNEIQSKIK